MIEPLIPRDSYAALKNWRYLNQASLGLVPVAATTAMTRFLEDVAQHGNIFLSDAAESRILDDVRAAAAALLDAPASAIALVGGASEGLGQVAALLARDDAEIVLVRSDFPSVTYPWLAACATNRMKIRWVEDRPDRDLTAGIVDAIGRDTAVVCVSAVQFGTGTEIDVGAVVRRAHDFGAHAVIDVTQLAGAAPVSMRRWGADALVCSGYKWLSTHGGVAILAMSDELLRRTPALVGWMGTAEPFDFRPTELRLAPDARRYELSTSAYVSAVGLRTSIALLMQAGLPRLADHAAGLACALVEAVADLGWSPFRPPGSASASNHIVSLRHAGLVAADVQRALAKQHRIIVSARGEGIRVSLHGYNDGEDIVRLAAALKAIAS